MPYYKMSRSFWNFNSTTQKTPTWLVQDPILISFFGDIYDGSYGYTYSL